MSPHVWPFGLFYIVYQPHMIANFLRVRGVSSGLPGSQGFRVTGNVYITVINYFSWNSFWHYITLSLPQIVLG